MSDLRMPVIHVVRRIRRDPRAVRVLITGGWGTTARRLANLLHSEGNTSLILTSRSGRVPAPFEHQCVTFDWFEESTYGGVFGNAYGGVDRVYLVAPPTIVSCDLCQYVLILSPLSLQEVMTAMKVRDVIFISNVNLLTVADQCPAIHRFLRQTWCRSICVPQRVVIRRDDRAIWASS